MLGCAPVKDAGQKTLWEIWEYHGIVLHGPKIFNSAAARATRPARFVRSSASQSSMPAACPLALTLPQPD